MNILDSKLHIPVNNIVFCKNVLITYAIVKSFKTNISIMNNFFKVIYKWRIVWGLFSLHSESFKASLIDSKMKKKTELYFPTNDNNLIFFLYTYRFIKLKYFMFFCLFLQEMSMILALINHPDKRDGSFFFYIYLVLIFTQLLVSSMWFIIKVFI